MFFWPEVNVLKKTIMDFKRSLLLQMSNVLIFIFVNDSTHQMMQSHQAKLGCSVV